MEGARRPFYSEQEIGLAMTPRAKSSDHDVCNKHWDMATSKQLMYAVGLIITINVGALGGAWAFFSGNYSTKDEVAGVRDRFSIQAIATNKMVENNKELAEIKIANVQRGIDSANRRLDIFHNDFKDFMKLYAEDQRRKRDKASISISLI